MWRHTAREEGRGEEGREMKRRGEERRGWRARQKQAHNDGMSACAAVFLKTVSKRVIGVLGGPGMRHINFTQCRPGSPAWLHHQIEIMDFVWRGQACTQPQRKWGHKGRGGLYRERERESLLAVLRLSGYNVTWKSVQHTAWKSSSYLHKGKSCSWCSCFV